MPYALNVQLNLLGNQDYPHELAQLYQQDELIQVTLACARRENFLEYNQLIPAEALNRLRADLADQPSIVTFAQFQLDPDFFLRLLCVDFYFHRNKNPTHVDEILLLLQEFFWPIDLNFYQVTP